MLFTLEPLFFAMRYKTMNFLKVLIPIFSILIISSLTTGCGPAHDIENEKLDSLDMKLEQSKENLNLDIKLIKLRKEEIAANREFILKNKKDTFTYDLGAQLDRYKALMKTYKQHIESYEHFIDELPQLEKQVKDLRRSLNRDEFTKDEFKKYYYIEENDVNALYEGSTKIKKALYELEPEYMRLSKYFDKEVAHVQSQIDTSAVAK